MSNSHIAEFDNLLYTFPDMFDSKASRNDCPNTNKPNCSLPGTTNTAELEIALSPGTESEDRRKKERKEREQ
ncbi:hypothetical protein DERP_015264 [Dermatophagoides pteronyssinus]|uniref:Uncharacterized protein n=1 Tax=Dermatophagoides pteronyssinus TaxID=6956 RepID=A0ABQ8JKP1_DERPT|nr:hypothetical protein DERP_015264 [Dermatophagoides pteronyssinus]